MRIEDNWYFLPGGKEALGQHNRQETLEHFARHGPAVTDSHHTTPFSFYYCWLGHLHRKRDSAYYQEEGQGTLVEDGFHTARQP